MKNEKDVLILAIESSCDETAAAVVKNGRTVLSNVINTQIAIHTEYGGVVPEIASRKHIENINPVIREALKEADVTLDDITAIGVTYGPGLVGALLVGVAEAKAIAFATDKPLVGVHHIEGHIAANYIENKELKPPFVALVVSGGHTHLVKVVDYGRYEIIGRTRDDAAGECFDKCARAMGFPYPGGACIDKASKIGDASEFKLPHPKVAGNEFDFSFSGLKTNVINLVHNAEQKGIELNFNNLAASVQKTISEILTEKTINAAKSLGYKTVAVAGGVSANSGVRNSMEKSCAENGMKLYLPELSLCGDNGAMIACQGYYNYINGITADSSLNAAATLSLEDL